MIGLLVFTVVHNVVVAVVVVTPSMDGNGSGVGLGCWWRPRLWGKNALRPPVKY